MLQTVREKVIVQPGGGVAILHSDLPEGAVAEVIAVVDSGDAWPEGFFENTYGKWQGGPLVRPPQPSQSGREPLV